MRSGGDVNHVTIITSTHRLNFSWQKTNPNHRSETGERIDATAPERHAIIALLEEHGRPMKRKEIFAASAWKRTTAAKSCAAGSRPCCAMASW